MNKRDLRFTFEEIVKIYDPKHSVQLNGMVHACQTTEGYAQLNDKNEVENLVIDSCYVLHNNKKLINTDILKDERGYVKIIEGVLQ